MKITSDSFELEDIFECGQCFRWNKNEDNSYTGVAFGKVLTLSKKGDEVCFSDDAEIWNEYFDLETDYEEIKKQLSKDEVTRKAIEKGKGIRILKQEFFETVISFIISQNNNIPRIKGIVEKLCEKYGKEIERGYFAFPEKEVLATLEKEDLAFLRAGYRDAYIIDAARKLVNNEIDMDVIKNAPIEDARREISKIKGVGPKVADCILLFGASRYEVFPTDVWMKRVLTELYGFETLTPVQINAFAKERFGNLAGFAQQYLFYSMREK